MGLCEKCFYKKGCDDTWMSNNLADCFDFVNNYVFNLICKDQIIDTTNLDENDPEYAMELFLNEFGWNKKLTKEQKEEVHVELVKIEKEDEIEMILVKDANKCINCEKDSPDLLICEDCQNLGIETIDQITN